MIVHIVPSSILVVVTRKDQLNIVLAFLLVVLVVVWLIAVPVEEGLELTVSVHPNAFFVVIIDIQPEIAITTRTNQVEVEVILIHVLWDGHVQEISITSAQSLTLLHCVEIVVDFGVD